MVLTEKKREYNKIYNKEYYATKKVDLKKKYGANVVCECGAEIKRYNLSSHKKTKKHMRILNNAKVVEVVEPAVIAIVEPVVIEPIVIVV